MKDQILLNKEKVHKSRMLYQLLRNLIWGSFLITLVLYIGMLGYHHLEHMSWIDAFVNAAMILSGMGPLLPLTTSAGKIFAGCYALFSGLGFIVLTGVIFSPIIHRFIKKIHIESNKES